MDGQANRRTHMYARTHTHTHTHTHAHTQHTYIHRVYLTKERCTPSDRWVAEQSIHKNTPYVTDDHVGFIALQSKHNYSVREYITQ